MKRDDLPRPIEPPALSSLAVDYASGMTSIRARRVQRLLKREFAGAEYVCSVTLGNGASAILGVSASGAALCATDGRGPHASVFKWLHGSTQVHEVLYDLLKDSLPVLSSQVFPLSVLRSNQAKPDGSADGAPRPAGPLLSRALRALR
jgi:hypothetical protein